MKSTLLLIAIGTTIAFCFSSCRKINIEKGTPACIQSKIAEIKAAPVQNPPVNIWEWKVDGKVYYYITSECCDQYNYLYDAACKKVCAPDGGFTGQGDGTCPVFSGSIEKVLFWKDER